MCLNNDNRYIFCVVDGRERKKKEDMFLKYQVSGFDCVLLHLIMLTRYCIVIKTSNC